MIQHSGRLGDSAAVSFPLAEEHLYRHDSTLADVILSQTDRWPSQPTEQPIWGLLRIVMAQQVSTLVACRIATQVKTSHPHLTNPQSDATIPDVVSLRGFGLPENRARCCVTVLQRSEEILGRVKDGESWEEALTGIKGIGPWTISVFRIMVLREPDVLPLGDVGLERAIAKVYGRRRNVERLSENWRPFRSVACWYLWRTLGNEQLG